MLDFRSLFCNWFGHLVERCTRLDQYLVERAAAAPDGRNKVPPIVIDLLGSLALLTEEIHRKATYLISLSAREVHDKRSTFYAEARAAAEEFRRLHGYVSHIPAPWPSPELEVFLRRVIEESGYRSASGSLERRAWTILLSGDYNFSHILVPPSAASRGMVPQNVLHVPAAEKDNPLIWPNLVHELAHIIGVESGIVSAAQELPLVEGKSGAVRKVLEEWTHEIVADLLATDFLGPAYFGAFVSFVAYWIPYSLRRRSRWHPEADCRVDYILRRLREGPKSLESALVSQLKTEYEGRLQLDYEDERFRTEFFEDIAAASSGKSDYPSNADLQEFASSIVELPSYRKVAPMLLTEGDAAIIEALGRRVTSGEIIASRREPSARITFGSEEEIRGKFEEALDQLRDKPNKIVHILNAALLRKLSYEDSSKVRAGAPVAYTTQLLDDFCRTPVAGSKRLAALRRDVNGLDLVISKSIEGAQILSFYQDFDEAS